ncbi:hypothetical protein [Sphingomonas sp. PR090111-T3T-6A]|uniref:hypothetical protein n=1 Tax=Sphingomonas sp. PR090111-T3T-6A TaxID=685778 RepID=UPI000370EDED|nr:hypothetical protein [Sphingomonas sp. PR090111-T3T-6A]
MKYASLTSAEFALSERDLLERLAASPVYGFRLGRPLSKLERDVLRLADKDGLSTIQKPGRVRGWFRWMLGLSPANPLADPRLEALRRYHVAMRFGRVDLMDQAANLRCGASWRGPARPGVAKMQDGSSS